MNGRTSSYWGSARPLTDLRHDEAMALLTARGSTTAWRRLRLYVLERDGWRCLRPLEDGKPHGLALTRHNPRLPSHATVGHIVDRSAGGQDVPANLRAECARCNYRAGQAVTTAAGRSARLNSSRSW